MVFLWVFGDSVEAALGHLTYLLLYLLAGFAAVLAHVAAFPTSGTPVIGASGAIAGLLGAYLIMFPRAQVRVLLFFGPFFALGRLAAFFAICQGGPAGMAATVTGERDSPRPVRCHRPGPCQVLDRLCLTCEPTPCGQLHRDRHPGRR
ncbi:MAG: rhomboid family intramembrane serine protease [Chloroflexi bacterium]|nr:rhomboid family intramembrane serine protease [Chloroflexota bacterium]